MTEKVKSEGPRDGQMKENNKRKSRSTLIKD